MEDYKLGEIERRFANLIWDHEPLSSGSLVQLCAQRLDWKKSTAYTVLRKLCAKGLFENQGGQVQGETPPETAESTAGANWAGAAALALYGAGSLLGLRRRLAGSVPLRDNIRLADHIQSPFVLGLLRPRIYLPSGLPEKEWEYLILHEQIHIRRGIIWSSCWPSA